MNAIGGDTLQMLKFALGEVEKNFVGLVVGNQGVNFCVGANIMLMLMEAQEENWEELDMMGRVFPNATMSLRYSPKPVVVAPFQLVFGGGCEMVLHGDRVRAAAETYIGLVELASGIIPAGGGTKEMLLADDGLDSERCRRRGSVPIREACLETIALAKGRDVSRRSEVVGLSDEGRFDLDECRSSDCGCEEGSAGLAASGYVQPQQRTDILALGEPRSRR
jgi:3-hydroxyacyl-CoA dehydrogenase